MAVNLVPKGVTDPEVRLFLQQISNTPYIAPLVIDASVPTSEAIALITAKLNELIAISNTSAK